MIWIGVDPGSRFSGITARQGTALLAWRIIDRNDVEPGADRPGLATKEAVVVAIGEVADPAGALIAIEDTVSPVGHLGMANVADLIRTAEVVGYLQCAFPAAVLVRPNRHGKNTLASYPRELVSRSETQHAERVRSWLREAPQNSTMRHARSAWDLAGAGASAARIQLAIAAQRRN